MVRRGATILQRRPISIIEGGSAGALLLLPPA